MAVMKEVRLLMTNLLKGTVPSQFATIDDLEGLVRDELRKLAPDFNTYRRNQLEIFELIQSTVDEVLPRIVDQAIGIFAQVDQYAQGDKPVYKVRLGRQRAKQFVTRAGANGTYETFRLDNGEFTIEMGVYGGATYIDFERYLDGHENLMEFYQIIVEGLLDKVYMMIQRAMINSWNSQGRPAANKVSVNGFDVKAMQQLCTVVSAYGAPVIYCSPQFASEMTNISSVPNSSPNVAQQDLIDIREQGYIGKFHGVPVIVMPNSFTDGTNAHTVFNPRLAYVMPSTREKPVKVAFEGQTIVREYQNQGDQSMEMQAHKRMGCAIISGENSWAIYQNTGIADDDWDILAGSVYPAP